MEGQSTGAAPAAERGAPPTVEQLLDVYATMLTSRRFDERCTALLAVGTDVPHYHSGVGQEALMVASVAPLRRDDQILYTHRGYGHLLAKGVSLRELVLDLFMKAGGTNHGLGGVMHVHRPDIGIPGREGAFGARFGISAGMALASKLRGDDGVVVCFYGEAAGARGPLYEALNLSKLWHLPVVFVAENNGWSFTSRTEWLFPSERMSDAWRSFVPVDVVDGNDAEAVWQAVSAAVGRARDGAGPAIVEGMTYRVDPHIWWDDASYQPAEELARWRERDPLARTARRLRGLGVDAGELDRIDAQVTDDIGRAFAHAAAAEDATWETLPR